MSSDQTYEEAFHQTEPQPVKERVQQAATVGHRKAILSNRKAKPMYSGVGRNDPCPCGSGNKFKRCCLCKVAM